MSQTEVVENNVEEDVEIESTETVEDTVDDFSNDPRKVIGAYKRKLLISNENGFGVPVKSHFTCNSKVTVNDRGVHSVVATNDVGAGELIEECLYIVLETRVNDFINTLKDKIAARFIWTLPCDDEQAFMCEEFGSHLILPMGNCMAYQPSKSPNAYYEFDDVTRTIRFYSLRPIKEGEDITIVFTPETFGQSGITRKQLQDATGMENLGVMPGREAAEAPVQENQQRKTGGCKSCGQKKKFRDSK